MNAPAASKYDRGTRLLHAALAVGIIAQLSLSAVMHVPAGPGLGVYDWHRRAFEIHASVGLGVAAVCLLHWLWICLPGARPGVAYLFPWLWRESRSALYREAVQFVRLQVPTAARLNPLAGAVQGLGLLAVSGSAAAGLINYAGYFLGAPIPRPVLHWVALFHITMGYLLWAFVTAHVSMALLHWRRVSVQAAKSI